MRFLSVLLCVPVLSYASTEIGFNLEVDAYAQPVSINAFTSNWHDTLKSGDSAFLQGRAELFTQQNNHQLSLLWRYDYLLDFSEQTAQLYHTYANDKSPIANKIYPLKIKAKYSENYGVRWLQQFKSTSNFQWAVGLNLLKGYKLTDGNVEGSVLFLKPSFAVKDIKNAQLDVFYHYDEPQLQEQQLEWHPRNPSGLGFSIDAEVAWQIQSNLALNLILYDVYGRLYWQDVASTQYNLSCECSLFNHNIEGQLAIDSRYTQDLSTHGQLNLDYQYNKLWSVGLKSSFNQQMALWQPSIAYQYKTWQTRFLIEPQTHALGVEVKNSYMYLRWLADDLNTNQAHRLGLSLGAYKVW